MQILKWARTPKPSAQAHPTKCSFLIINSAHFLWKYIRHIGTLYYMWWRRCVCMRRTIYKISSMADRIFKRIRLICDHTQECWSASYAFDGIYCYVHVICHVHQHCYCTNLNIFSGFERRVARDWNENRTNNAHNLMSKMFSKSTHFRQHRNSRVSVYA